MLFVKRMLFNGKSVGFELLLVLALLLCPPPGSAAEDEGEPKPLKLFEVEDTIQIALSAPWRTIVRKPSVQDPYPTTIEWTDELGNSYSRALTVQRRASCCVSTRG